MKKIPLRKCLATNEQLPKKELIRVVRNKECQVFVDPTGKMNGRGAYLKKSIEAIEIANDTQYGLGGYVYTSDKAKYDTMVKKLKTGMIALNNLYYLRPCNPFGGYKKSGMGKNNSEFGLRELCNIKVVIYEK